MIQSFDDEGTEDIYHGKNSKKARNTLSQSLVKIALRKLEMLDVAHTIEDLKTPPNNRLEALTGNLRDNWSIRINDQYRVVFKWTPIGVEDVKIMDYH